MPAYRPLPGDERTDALGSTYIPVDSIVYPMALRLYSLGYLDTAFISMRPWSAAACCTCCRRAATISPPTATTRRSPSSPSCRVTWRTRRRAAILRADRFTACERYTRVMGIGGPVLRDSFHLGQTVYNDYGRPYLLGFNNMTGFTSVNEYGRFSLYVPASISTRPHMTVTTSTSRASSPASTRSVRSFHRTFRRTLFPMEARTIR